MSGSDVSPKGERSRLGVNNTSSNVDVRGSERQWEEGGSVKSPPLNAGSSALLDLFKCSSVNTQVSTPDEATIWPHYKM